jgi:superoxide reductase
MSAKAEEVYKCDICGNVVFVVEGGDGDLVCCGENMKLLNEEESKPYLSRFPKPGSP